MEDQRKNRCYLFNVLSTIPTYKVNDDLEKSINCPDSLVVILDESHRFFIVETKEEKILTWKCLFKNRKRIRIDGLEALLIFPDNILGSVQFLFENELLWIADRQLFEQQSISVRENLYENVHRWPAFDTSSVSKSFSIIEAPNLIKAINFDNNLRIVLFEIVDPEIISNSPLSYPITTIDDANAFSPLKKINKASSSSPSMIRIDLANGSITTNIYKGCIFSADNIDAIVLPTMPNLQCIDGSLQRKLLQHIDADYIIVRDLYLDNHTPALENGEVVTLGCKLGVSLSKAKWIMHAVITDQSGLMLYTPYLNCLKEAKHHGFERLAFSPFLTSKVKDSADAASEAIIYANELGIIKTGRFVFIHYNLFMTQLFGNAFTAACHDGNNTKSKSTTGIKKKIDYADEDDGWKLDQAMALPIKMTATKDAKAAAVAAQLLEMEQGKPIDLKGKSIRESRPYGKRSQNEKRQKKELTLDQLKKADIVTTACFVKFLEEGFPKQESCWLCEKPKLNDDDVEICQRCYRWYHFVCLDKDNAGAGGTCPFCYTTFKFESGIAIGDQLEGGTMKIRIVNDAELTLPGYPNSMGHIEITYSIPSGLQGTNNPKPGEFCYGIHRIAYLPNTEEGLKMAEMLNIAFDRGLTFTVGKSISFWGDDYSVIWNCIPHKINLKGGRAMCGYPDPTYLFRLERLLNKLGVRILDESMSSSSEAEADADE